MFFFGSTVVFVFESSYPSSWTVNFIYTICYTQIYSAPGFDVMVLWVAQLGFHHLNEKKIQEIACFIRMVLFFLCLCYRSVNCLHSQWSNNMLSINPLIKSSKMVTFSFEIFSVSVISRLQKFHSVWIIVWIISHMHSFFWLLCTLKFYPLYVNMNTIKSTVKHNMDLSTW